MDGTALAPSAACPSASSGPGESPSAAGTWSQRERQEGSDHPRQGDEGTSMAPGGSAFPAVPSVAAVAAAAGIPELAYYRQEGRQGAWTWA